MSSPIVSPISRWALDPGVVHLNHGSFGGCLRATLAAAAAIRDRVEGSPMRYFVTRWQAELDEARTAAAAFVGADPARTAFVANATTGVALALASCAEAIGAGDELVTTDHAYRACRNQLDRLAAACGAGVVVVRVPEPFDADALVAAFARALGPRTRLALVDHITSPTALILPLERMLDELAARGIPCIVDGAHAPGQIALDVAALAARGATYYAGNFHKWVCAPKSSGFLAVAAGAAWRPLVTSHGASADYGPPNRLHAELDWGGTHDPAPHLAVPAAIADVAEEVGGGWPEVRARNHALALGLRARLADALGGTPPALPPAAAIGAMATVPIALPPGLAPAALQLQLLERGWEVPVVEHGARLFVRVSAHLYNGAADADAFARELHAHRVTLAI
ncbi:MAG: aminotransferase class V-fold PLP-dependent enzyme [Deltaproteobacteria bacterium]|nr:aminotransferase class V-fold PLP-dependent enzyme [Deltaproteobacteria bacterium]